MKIGKKEITVLHDGKDIERMLEKWFEQNQGDRYFFHRLPDTHAAQGNNIDSQPADFMIVLPNSEMFFIELKTLNEDWKWKFATFKFSDKQYETYEKSVDLEFNYLTLTYQRGPEKYLLIPSWLLRREELSQGQKTIDFEPLIEEHPWLVVSNTKELINRILTEPLLRNSHVDKEIN